MIHMLRQNIAKYVQRSEFVSLSDVEDSTSSVKLFSISGMKTFVLISTARNYTLLLLCCCCSFGCVWWSTLSLCPWKVDTLWGDILFVAFEVSFLESIHSPSWLHLLFCIFFFFLLSASGIHLEENSYSGDITAFVRCSSTSTVLLHGISQVAVEETERSFYDAYRVARIFLQNPVRLRKFLPVF